MSALDLPQTRTSRLIDPFLQHVGEAASWLWLLLLLIIVGNVVLRYAFEEGRIELEEIQWHIYSFGFLLGLAYAFQADAHIRVDVVSERLQPRTRAWLELYGLILGLLPFIALFLIHGLPFVQQSWAVGEVSQAPGGLPYRWFIKAVLPFSFALLLLAVWSRLTRVWLFLFGDLR
ncbi:MAG: TRAP transporter small permease subunit [Gammaproteobacteria bacterium]|nr:TRAP transporter small permease subunit [Gammaproteobacteria bacterium]